VEKIFKIGIDALGINEVGGGRTSILNYLEIITAESPKWQFIIYLSNPEPSLNRDNVNQIILPFSRGIIARIFMQLYLPFEIMFRNLKLIHFTKGQASLVPKAKKVLTIHDLTTILHPNIHKPISVFYWMKIQPWMARKMDAIFTVSQNTAKDVINYFGVKSEKLNVIYNTSQFYNEYQNSPPIKYDVIEKYSLRKNYILYVGLIAMKKNLETLVNAIDILCHNGKNVPPLILVGPRYTDSDASYIFKLIEDLNLQDRIIYLGKIPKADLYHIFKAATTFVFPSIHEGFGIPCLEAMELGVPVIASDTSGINEVMGNAGILIDDYLSPNAWAEAIDKVSKDPSLRHDLINKGFDRAKEIHANHSPTEAIEIYKTLLKNREEK
jgi:glycosyltransferase involved in cell wall biosynthesis